MTGNVMLYYHQFKYIYNSMVNCYRFKNIKNNKSIFDNFVDMTYVLLMENSKRELNRQITELLKRDCDN